MLRLKSACVIRGVHAVFYVCNATYEPGRVGLSAESRKLHWLHSMLPRSCWGREDVRVSLYSRVTGCHRTLQRLRYTSKQRIVRPVPAIVRGKGL